VTTRNRSQDLTADLLHEIDDAESEPGAQPEPGRPVTAPATDDAAAPFLETTLFLAPRTWLRPGIARTGSTVAVSAGPVRFRLGRG
jgi:hypothetical protein